MDKIKSKYLFKFLYVEDIFFKVLVGTFFCCCCFSVVTFLASVIYFRYHAFNQ